MVVELWEEDGGQRCLTCGHDCPGFEPHSWRNSCSKCSCDRGSHDVSLDYCISGRERFGVEGFNESLLRKNKKKFEKLGYAWTPPDLNKDKIEEFMNQFEERKRPKLGTVGERYRMIQLLKQLPKQDMTEGCCRHIETTEEKEGYSEFRTKRNTEAFDIAIVKEVPKDCSTAKCGGCNDKMETGKLAIFVPKLGDSPSFHVSCFRCSKCLEFPVDLCCCIHEGKVYCERHYADLIKPRCAGCDELIFCREYSNAMSRDFHKSHLACFRCDSSLSGQKYMTKNERPYCVSCYEIQFAHKCDYCKAIIGAGSKELSHKDSFWHDTCFKCIECRKSLVDKPFAVNSGKLYCPDCHDNKFAAKCNKCGKVFKPGFEKYEYQGRQWHEDCFLCYDCDRPIRSKSFIPRDDKIYCNTCYEKRFAKHCFKCKGVVGKLFVTYMDAPWHRECFNCKRCRKNLAEETFTRHQDDPFCTECYTDLFAKKCCRCLKPISGYETSGSTKFVTFETRHWHNSCFTCYRCGLSLAGKKFAAEGTDILCADCSQ